MSQQTDNIVTKHDIASRHGWARPNFHFASHNYSLPIAAHERKCMRITTKETAMPTIKVHQGLNWSDTFVVSKWDARNILNASIDDNFEIERGTACLGNEGVLVLTLFSTKGSEKPPKLHYLDYKQVCKSLNQSMNDE
jgi:hypothetical protein